MIQQTVFGGAIIMNNITGDDTQTDILALNGAGQLVYRSAASIANNPFNQSLNTTDTPTFAGAAISYAINDNTQNALLALNGSNEVVWRAATTVVNNPFNQSLNTTNSPTFAGATITSAANYNTTTKLLALGAANAVVYRSIPVGAAGSYSAYALAASQTVAASTLTTVAFPAAQISNGIGFTYTGSIFNVSVAGIYLLEWSIVWNSSILSSTKQTYAAVGGAAVAYGNLENTDSVQHSSAILNLATGATFQIQVEQTSLTSTTILSGSPSCTYLNVTLIQAF